MALKIEVVLARDKLYNPLDYITLQLYQESQTSSINLNLALQHYHLYLLHVPQYRDVS